MVNKKRLHPVSWLFIIIEYLKQFFFLIVIALFVGGGDRYDNIAVFFVVPAIGVAILQYWVYRYSLDTHEIIIREGLIFKNIRHVPYERVQNLNLSRNPLHRFFGVAQVELESASGGKPEAVMRVVSLEEVAQLKQKILEFQDHTVEADDSGQRQEPENKELHKISTKELVKAGIISNKGMIVVAALFGFLSQSRAFDDKLESVVDNIEQWVGSANIELSSPLSITVLGLLGIVAFFICIRLLSIIFMVFTYHGFKLQLANSKLMADYGLLTHISATLPQVRIQLLTISQNILHRYFSRATIRVESAGGGGAEQASKSQLTLLAPIVESEKVDSLVEQSLPQLNHQMDSWNLVEFRAWKRITRFWSSLIVIASVGLCFVSLHFLHLLWLIIWVVVASRKYVSSIRYGLNEDTIVVESGWVVKHCSIAPLSKIQSLELSQSPLDRRAGMANLVADGAGISSTRHHIDIPYLDVEVAKALLENLHQVVSETRYQWK